MCGFNELNPKDVILDDVSGIISLVWRGSGRSCAVEQFKRPRQLVNLQLILSRQWPGAEASAGRKPVF